MTDTPKRFPASAAPRQKASTHSGLRPPAATQSSAHFGTPPIAAMSERFRHMSFRPAVSGEVVSR